MGNELGRPHRQSQNMIQLRNISRKWFETVHLTVDLKTRSVKGGANTVVAQFLSFGMSMLSTAIMARLVAPESFGVVAMVTAITGFITIFMDLGFSSAVIQNKKVTQKQVSTLFWFNILIGFSIAGCIALLAPAIAAFYQEPRLLAISWAYAFSILISSLALQHNALLKRQMKFKRISVITIIATAVSIVIGIGMAVAGFDYWAIVGITVSFAVVNCLLTWAYCDWRPSLTFNLPNAKGLVKFGFNITGFDLVNYFARNLDNILIGRYIGAVALGLYSKSYQLLMIPITQLRGPLNTVAMPALSALQEQPGRYSSFYRNYVFLLAFFSMPLVVFLFVYVDEIILMVLGGQWTGAGYIFQLLAVAAFIQPVGGTSGVVLITMGQTRKYFILGVVNAVLTVAGYAIGIKWGVAGVAISYIIVNYVTFLPSLYWAFRQTPIQLSSFLSEITYPIIFSLISGLIGYMFKDALSPYWPHFLLLVVGFTVGASVYISLWFLSKQTAEKFKSVLKIRTLLRQ